jgi:hypothetical protein
MFVFSVAGLLEERAWLGAEQFYNELMHFVKLFKKIIVQINKKCSCSPTITLFNSVEASS